MTAAQKENAARDRYAVRSVLRAAALLRAFSSDQPSLPLADLARRAGLDKATARRLLMTLKQAELIDQSQTTQHYSLGLGILRIAGAVPTSRHLSELADDLLRSLAARTEATVFLSVRRDTHALCIGRYLSDSPVQVRWWDVGGERPMNCGAAPRLLLAYAPEAERERAIEAGLARYTDFSELDPDRLRASLDEILDRGWTLAVDDVFVGLSALAVPVHDSSGGFVGAISLAGLTAQLAGPKTASRGPATEPRQIEELRATAAALARRIPPGLDFAE